jgi:hypothetical protein
VRPSTGAGVRDRLEGSSELLFICELGDLCLLVLLRDEISIGVQDQLGVPMTLPFGHNTRVCTVLQGIDDKGAPERPRRVDRHSEALAVSVQGLLGVTPGEYRFASLDPSSTRKASSIGLACSRMGTSKTLPVFWRRK